MQETPPTNGQITMPVEPDNPEFQGDPEEIPQSSEHQDSSSAQTEVSETSVGAAVDAISAALNATPGTPELPTKPAHQARDYSDLAEEEVPLFKRMSNETFDVIKPKWLSYKKLEADHAKLKSDFEEASKSSFYDHPEAYKLSKEFTDYSNQIALADFEVSHWKKALASIKANQKVSILTGYNQQGSPVYEEQDPTPELEADVIGALQQALQIRTNASRDLEAHKNSFSTQHKTFQSKMGEIEANIFKGTDPNKLEAAMKAKLSLFPSHLHNRFEYRTIAKLLAVLDGFEALFKARNSTNLTQTAKARIAVNSGPRTTQIKSGGSPAHTVGSAVDAFNHWKAKNNY